MAFKVLYVGLRKENYNPRRGMSFEYNNFYLPLTRMNGVRVIEHPFDRILEVGREKFNDELLHIVDKEKPDVLFVFMYTDELERKTLVKIRDNTHTTSIAWFADDYWRFFNYSRDWPSYFNWVVTTYSKAVAWYRRAGHENVILSQWGCDTSVYRPVEAPKDIDVSFVGQWKPQRARVIDALRSAGVNVEAYGFGWPNGKVSQEDMIRIFSRSKINLNLSVRPGLFSPRVLARLFMRKSINRLVPDFHFIRNLRAYLHFPTLHTHARPFELAGCQAFTISGRSEDIGYCFKENKEMVFYDTPAELVKKVKYYVSHNDEREHIARAAYERTLLEHTYEQRFVDVFEKSGVPIRFQA